MTEWSEADFVRCFDSEPATGEHGDSRRFMLSRHGFDLEVIVWPERMDARVTLRHGSQESALAEIWFHDLVKAEYVSSGGAEWLMFMKTLGDHPVAAFRVKVHPEFLLAFEDFAAPAARPAR